MIVNCGTCGLDYDDARCWTLCPHNPLHRRAGDKACKKHDLFDCDLGDCEMGKIKIKDQHNELPEEERCLREDVMEKLGEADRRLVQNSEEAWWDYDGRIVTVGATEFVKKTGATIKAIVPGGGLLDDQQAKRFVEVAKDDSIVLDESVEVPLSGPQHEAAMEYFDDDETRREFHRLCQHFRAVEGVTSGIDPEHGNTVASLTQSESFLSSLAMLIQRGWRLDREKRR